MPKETAIVPRGGRPTLEPKSHAMEQLEATIATGPAMKALAPKARAFVMALIELGGQPQDRAAAMAGYTGSLDVLRVTASRLAADPRVQDALVESALVLAKSNTLAAVAVCVKIMIDENANKQVRLTAASRIMTLAGMDPGQRISVEHTHGIAQGTTAELAQVMQLCKDLGLDAQAVLGKAGVVIEAEFTEVPPVPAGRTGLEDLL